MNEEAIAAQAPELKAYPAAHLEQVKTPAVVADPSAQLVAVVGILTHCPYGERYFPATQPEQVKTPALVAEPLAHPTLVCGIATQALLER